MSEILPPAPETNIRKWIFVGIVCGILFLIIAFFVFMSGAGGKTSAGKGFNPTHKEVVLWTVGMDAKVFKDLNAQFNTFLGRNDMKLSVQNFGSFEDYIDILPRAIQSGTAPDLIVVPNH